jgi:hypothetical protein
MFFSCLEFLRQIYFVTPDLFRGPLGRTRIARGSVDAGTGPA